MTAPTASDPRTLKRRVFRAGGWTVAGYTLSQAIRLGSNLVMTRLLVPEMFGVMAIATMVTVILSLLSDIGLRQNIIQNVRGDDPIFLDTAWVLQIVRGVILWILAITLSAALHFANHIGIFPSSSVYASSVLPFVIAVSSFSAIVLGFQSTKIATSDRHFDQKRIIQIELAGQCTGLLVMIVIGVLSRSIWALVAGGLVSSVTTTILSHTWMTGHSNRFRWEKNALKDLLRFGKWVFVSSAAGILAVNGDRLLLGGFVEGDVMGFYAIAILFVGSIRDGMYRLFSSVSLPALSEIARHDPATLRDAYYKVRVPCDLLLLFTAGFLFSAGQLLIDLLYDARYSAAGSMLEILALSLFVARYGVGQQVYLALGLPRYLAAINIVRFVSLYALVPPLYYAGGTHAAIWGIALHGLTTLPLVYAFGSRLGVNDFHREVIVLVALPMGFLCGSTINLLLK